MRRLGGSETLREAREDRAPDQSLETENDGSAECRGIVSRTLRRTAVLPIRVYQRLISPLTPPSCRFVPNCSEYGAQAILAHGVLKGWLLAIWRILRCHPFHPGGLDPIPPPGHWRASPCNHDGESGSSHR